MVDINFPFPELLNSDVFSEDVDYEEYIESQLSKSSNSLDVLTEFYQECIELRKKVMTENMLLGAIALGAATYAIGIKNMLKLLGMLISALGKLISFCVTSIKKLFTFFIGGSSGDEGLISGAVSRVKNTADRIIVREGTLPIVLNNGITMQHIGKIQYIFDIFAKHITLKDNVNKLFNGEEIFSSKEDMYTRISLERFNIVSIFSKNPELNLSGTSNSSGLRNSLENLFYSRKGTETEYDLSRIIVIFSEYKSELSRYQSLQRQIESVGKSSIRYLEEYRNRLSKDNTLASHVKDTINEQINLLIEYKTIVMNDALIALECYMKYISKVHMQCKAILTQVIASDSEQY